MGYVNKIMLMGNTTRDPVLRQLPSGTGACDFGLATNRIYKTPAGEERQETVFVDCIAYGRTAEVIAEYCPKGRTLFVEGRLRFEAWEDQEGNRRNKLRVIVEQFQFVGVRNPQEGETMGEQMELPVKGAVLETGRKDHESPTRRGAEKQAGKLRIASSQSSPGIAGKSRGAAKAQRQSAGEAVDVMAEEAQQLADADLPF